jgi:3-oxoacyl-[acyl-carrier-protein] synthase-3|tara:strand:+ start:92 stop:1060 length:969 start_codon:yes stop_codon:yes gene_type:complete
MFDIKISGTGIYLPPRVETSEELVTKINKPVDWIHQKAGVFERRVSDIDVDKMGAIAGKEALNNGPPPDLIINASGVPKQTIPDTSTFFQKELGFDGVPSFSIHCTCLSFIAALHTASSLIQSKSYKRILIISSDRGTVGRNFKEPESASLLGDGAAAVLVEPSDIKDRSQFLYHTMNTWPSGTELTEVRGGGTRRHPLDPNTSRNDNLFSMDGPAVYKIARKEVYRMLLKTLKETGLKRQSIDWVVPHQASKKAVEAYSTVGGFKKEKVLETVSRFGNCVAASVPMTLVMAIKNDQIKRDDLVMLIGTGAGLSAACSIFRY